MDNTSAVFNSEMSNRSSSKQHCLVGAGSRRPTTSHARKRNKAKAHALQVERQEVIQAALAEIA